VYLYLNEKFNVSVSRYTYDFFEIFLSDIGRDNIIFADTDTIIYIGNLQSSYLKPGFKTKNHKCHCYFIDSHKYFIYYKEPFDSDVEIKGLTTLNGKHENVLDTFKTIKRDRNIKQLLS
jgi:hypothetical protein